MQELSNQRKVVKLYNALMLERLITETPPEAVAKEYLPQRSNSGVSASDLKYLTSLQDRAARLSGMLASFCERSGFVLLELLLSKFQGRVFHGVRPEVVVLTAIPGVRGFRARMLYDAGLRSVEDVADASADEVFIALTKGREKFNERAERKCAADLGHSARRLLNERASEALDAGEHS